MVGNSKAIFSRFDAMQVDLSLSVSDEVQIVPAWCSDYRRGVRKRLSGRGQDDKRNLPKNCWVAAIEAVVADKHVRTAAHKTSFLPRVRVNVSHAVCVTIVDKDPRRAHYGAPWATRRMGPDIAYTQGRFGVE